jgi:pimeloyl-ACP methyl ester carboxylesterase
MDLDEPGKGSVSSGAPVTHTRYRTIDVNGVGIFYREVGPPDAPLVLLLHGYPSSSRMFEPLMARLGDSFRLIAPDYPGFGHSSVPGRSFPYTFESLAQTLQAFTEVFGLRRYALYLQDYGGPVGLRLALARPERVRALIIQNAVLHEEGLTPLWEPRRAFWLNRAANEAKIRELMLSVAAGVARHVGGRTNPEYFNPDLWMDEIHFLERPGVADRQLDLAYDYRTNVAAYPRWQAYLRERRPPTLVVWGRHDPIFSLDGANAIRRELPATQLHVLEAGHFALNDEPDRIAAHVRAFLGSLPE